MPWRIRQAGGQCAPLSLLEQRNGADVCPRRLAHHQQALRVAAPGLGVAQDVGNAGGDIIHHGGHRPLWKVPVVQARDHAAGGPQPGREQGAPGLVADDPHAASHENHDGRCHCSS